MCPACIATAAWLAAGAGSASGLTAFVFSKRRPNKGAGKDEQHKPGANVAAKPERSNRT